MSAARLRKIHRLLGLFFGVSLLLSSSSGILHQVMARTQSPPPPVKPEGAGWTAEDILVPLSQVIKNPESGKLTAVNVRNIGGDPWYQLFFEGAADPVYVNARTGGGDAGVEERYARQIASAYLGGKRVEKTDYLTGFNGEYLNIFRILPVYRFDARDPKGTRVYVSTITGSVTRHTDNQRQFEANVFSNLHKLAFIPNRDIRDFVLITMTAGTFLAAVAGIVVFAADYGFGNKRRKNRETPS